VAELNRICSDYDLDSELSRLSAQSPTSAPVPVSADLYRVLSAAQELSERSGGALDVTVGPVTRLWRRARLQKKPPEPERLQAAMQGVGYRGLVLGPQRTVELKRPGMRLDLGAIAKGYAVDEVLRTLREFGITRALANAGGSISVGDPPPGESAWRIDVAPLERNDKPTRSVWLANSAVATSGDTHQFLEFNGKRYSHIIDPRTGWGLTERSSVSVIAPTGMLADGLSTAVSVLGPVAGLKLVEDTPGAAAYFVLLRDERIIEHRSARYSDFTREGG
jgi:thiamine biosynthesis lipoprotein